MSLDPEVPSERRIVRLFAALGLINLLLVAPLWWRDGAWGSAWLMPELGLLPLLALWPAARRSQWLPWALACLLTLAFAALLGDALVRAVFSRPLDILLDPWLLRAGFHLLDGSLGTPTAVLVAVLAALGVVATAMAMRALLGRTLRPMPSRLDPVLVMVAVVAVASIWFAPAGGIVRPALVGLVQTQSEQVRATLTEREALLSRAGSQRMRAMPMTALAGRDVVIVFVESYGVSALDQPRYSDTLNPILNQAEARLAESGLGAISTRMKSPIRGGQSWLSHATVLSGQPIDNDYWYSMLLDSEQGFLADDFRLSGHTPLVVAPAIVRPWPEARALGFEAIYPAAALEYGGPSSGWVGIPDQYTLHRYSRHLRLRHSGPVFSVVLLISSHAPWSPGPPLIDDWNRLDRDNPWPGWSAPPNDRLAYWRNTDQLRARYPQSLAYSLEAVFSWAANDLPEDALLIVLGDHQATPLITGPGAGADVPVHMISSDAALLERIARPNMGNGLVLQEVLSPSAGLESMRFVLREL